MTVLGGEWTDFVVLGVHAVEGCMYDCLDGVEGVKYVFALVQLLSRAFVVA